MLQGYLNSLLLVSQWATILAPKTSVKFLSSSNRGRNGISTHGRMWSWVAIGALVVFIAAVTVPTVFLSLTHSTEYAAIDYLFTQLDEAEAANTGIAGLVVLLPTYATINGIAGSALVRYRALCGTYFAFAMLWMIVCFLFTCLTNVVLNFFFLTCRFIFLRQRVFC